MQLIELTRSEIPSDFIPSAGEEMMTLKLLLLWSDVLIFSLDYWEVS